MISALVATSLLVTSCDSGSSSSGHLTIEVSAGNLRHYIQSLSFSRANLADEVRASEYIVSELNAFGYEAVSLQDFANGVFGPNISVRIDGTTRPNEVLVIGAHYDTVDGTVGADDNTSGVAGLVEIARVLRDETFETSVELVFFAGEEFDLAGSFAYVESFAGSGETVIGAIILEMIAYTCSEPGCQVPFFDFPDCLDVEPELVNTGEFIGVVANLASVSLMQAFADAAASAVSELPRASAVVAGTGECFPDTQRSDHFPFWEAGLPAIMLTDTADFRNPNYHLPSDTVDTLNLEFAAQVTRTVIATITHLAGGVTGTADPEF